MREFEPRLFDLFAAANLVIARGGYNTVLELKQLGIPAICIPARRGTEDQKGRIRMARQAGANIQLGSLASSSLAASIRTVAEEAWWRCQTTDKSDEIVANRATLALRLLALRAESHLGDWRNLPIDAA
jgi:predicted glycosyltransferase